MASSSFSKAEAAIPRTDIVPDTYSSVLTDRIAEYGVNPGIDNGDGNGRIDKSVFDGDRATSHYLDAYRVRTTEKPAEPIPGSEVASLLDAQLPESMGPALQTENPDGEPADSITPPSPVAKRIGPKAHYEPIVWPKNEADDQTSHYRTPGRTALRGLATALSPHRLSRWALSHKEDLPHVSIKGLPNSAKTKAQKARERAKAWGHSKDRSENQSLVTESLGGRSKKLLASAAVIGALAWGDFKKHLESAPKLSRPDIDIARYAKVGAITINAARNLPSRSYEAAKSLAKDEKHHETRRKLKIGAAVVVVGGLAVAAAGYYMSNKTGHFHQPSQEAISQNPAQHTKFPEFTLPPALQVAKVQAAHHAHAIAKHAGYHMEHLRYYGDTIWFHAKAAVVAKFPHASPEKIGLLTNKYSQLIVRTNHIKDTWHMFIGQDFKMPNLRLK